MPRVSDEHLESRRRQILDAARDLFAANGFHSTSMQEILRASELSAGAVYRYFPGKEDIIAAIAQEAMTSIRGAIEREPDHDLAPLELIEDVMHAVDEHADRHDVGRIALQVWAEAGRSPKLRAVLAESIVVARAALAAKFRRRFGDDIAADDIAAVVVSLLPGYLHARVIVGDMTPERYVRGLGGLAEVVERAPTP